MLYVILYKIIEQLYKSDHRLKHKTDNCRLITFLTNLRFFITNIIIFAEIYAAFRSHSSTQFDMTCTNICAFHTL